MGGWSVGLVDGVHRPRTKEEEDFFDSRPNDLICTGRGLVVVLESSFFE